MKVRLTEGAQKQLRKIPVHLRKKARKQFLYLAEDFRHPSLNVKKFQGNENLWQGRIDKSWRFYFHIIEPDYIIVSVVNHPK